MGFLTRKEDTCLKAAQEDRLLQLNSCTSLLAVIGLSKYIHFYVHFYGIHKLMQAQAWLSSYSDFYQCNIDFNVLISDFL